MRAATFVYAAALALVASICPAQVDERCPGTALDGGPKLLTSLEPLKAVARAATGERQFTFRITVTETGAVRDPVIKFPEKVSDSTKLEAEILKLRFCPAVRFSRYTEVSPEFHIDLRRL